MTTAQPIDTLTHDDVTPQEVAYVVDLLRKMKREKRTLIIQCRVNGPGIYAALTLTPKELKQIA